MQPSIVMIATPHGDMVHPEWLDAFMALEKPRMPDGSRAWARASVTRMGYAESRNMLTAMMLMPTHPRLQPTFGYANQEAKALAPQATHLLFWDDDIFPPLDGLMRLLARDVDIVGGLYITRGDPAFPVVLMRDGDPTVHNGYRPVRHFRPSGLQEVDAIGTGFLLIKRAVFEAMEDPWFQYLCLPGLNTVSEDVYFCQRAKELGFRVYLDFTVQVGHWGKHMFNAADILSPTPSQPLVVSGRVPAQVAQPGSNRKARRDAERRR